MEVIVTSENSGQLWNSCVWDPLAGTVLRTFKGGISGSNSLCVVGGDYLLSSLKDKPVLQVNLIYILTNDQLMFHDKFHTGLGIE